MDSAIRELICEDSSDSQDSVVSVSSSVSSASYVSSKRSSVAPDSPKMTSPIKSPKKRISHTSPSSSHSLYKHSPKKAKLGLIEQLRSVINSPDSDTEKVQKAKQLFELHPHYV